MPTGYTYGVADGTIADHKEYILTCARAFGAMMHQRDNSLSSDLQPREKSAYYDERVATDTEELQKYSRMTVEEAQVHMDAEYEEEMVEYKNRVEENAKQQSRYKEFLKRVKAWKPPTPEHDGLKKFAIEQLEESIRYDDYEPAEPRKPKYPSVWLAQKILEATQSLAYAVANLQEEDERVEKANAWIESLRKSLS